MDEIIKRARTMKYTAFDYIDTDDINKATFFKDSNDIIILYLIKHQDKRIHIFWATNSLILLIKNLKDLINVLKTNNFAKYTAFLEFIPEEFLKLLSQLGFRVISKWVDFWNNDIVNTKIIFGNYLIRPIKEDEISKVARITKACIGYSREYKGETEDFVREWIETQHCDIFVAEVNKEVVGTCFVQLYGFNNEKGIVLWIRELAVTPQYHSQGFGRALMNHALSWGIKNDAKRSFLACDVENKNAIHLYESLNYKRNKTRGQINVATQIKNVVIE